jgi:hypothetical protein
MPTDIKRILIESMLDKTIRDAKESPRRTVRNLIDMGLNFSKGRFQKKFLSYAQDMLKNQNSAYYDLAENIFNNVDKSLLLNFCINLGYNGCTKGAKKIRRMEAEKGFNIPWSLSIVIDPDRLNTRPDLYRKIIEQGMALGIYVYLLFLPEGECGTLPQLLERYPDCAFAVFFESGIITDEFAKQIKNLNTTMVAVRKGAVTNENCRRLRENNILFAVYYQYEEAEIDNILTDEWFEKIMEYLPQFIFLKADCSCSMQMQEKVYDRVLEVRKRQNQPVFCIELLWDLWKIDEIISDDACVIGFKADGSLCMYSEIQYEETCNIFESSLEDILCRAASRK